MRRVLAFSFALSMIALYGYLAWTHEEPLGDAQTPTLPCRANPNKSVEERIKECPIPAQEMANFKASEIAKMGPKPRKTTTFSHATYDIEIVGINAIEGGVEIFARAWDNNGQIGFGDGTVRKAITAD